MKTFESTTAFIKATQIKRDNLISSHWVEYFYNQYQKESYRAPSVPLRLGKRPFSVATARGVFTQHVPGSLDLPILCR